MLYYISAMTYEFALIISQWKYDNEYSIYSFEQSQETIAELLNDDYIACTDENNNLVGYFCQGKSARIPTKHFGYSNDRMDIGLGMCPVLCGKGIGYNFVLCGIKYFTQQKPGIPLRLTVACFNERAISLYKKIGFSVERIITHKISGKPFYVMVKQED